MLPNTAERVPMNTSEAVNELIRTRTLRNLDRAALGDRGTIDRRLAELDSEWDIERCLEVNAASVSIAGCLLGLLVNRRFFVLPALVGGFLLQHALQGWCPPLPLMRRLGVRTLSEIDDERQALLALRARKSADGLGRTLR
ncbi:MAG: DUF2892 domain-containing protein [Methyloversatilis discipulorum]|jgi:hypothetical protein|uniref:hypothetical protein n=1 Tax=Methyloversatilis discipulorum TaxID=1119528 RepID=UPI0026EC729E|nr:hypothetical protein [Methyloversatilis discipulorum]MBV5285624.1 DUF2892 domain-containing protein [Methyloversatilis discipulorum]